MPLDPADRYLVARPCGGFNDCLVQLEKVASYAEKFDRVLVLDMERSGLGEPLDAVFEVTQDFGPKVIIWNRDVASALDAMTSVQPTFLKHRISRLQGKFKRPPGLVVDIETDLPIYFDFARDHDAQVLVYQQAGGGRSSFRALKRLKLRADVANEVVARLRPLGRGYDAIHVRHSDYKTKFRRFLWRMRPLLRRRRVLICSDSATAKDAAAHILHRSTTVMSVADIPSDGLKPLHLDRSLEAHQRTLDFLTDLFGLALADRLFFTTVTHSGYTKSGYSGFSLLAEMLRRNPDVVRHLLENAEESTVDALFAPPVEQPGLYRRAQIWAQDRARAQIENKAKTFRIFESNQEIPPHRIAPVYRE